MRAYTQIDLATVPALSLIFTTTSEEGPEPPPLSRLRTAI